MHVWECDLLDVQAYAKYNDNYRYILSVIDLFTKIYISSPQRQRAVILSPRLFGPYSMALYIQQDVVQYGFALIRARKF